MRKREGGMWRDLVALTLAALLLGAAIVANVSDGPMRDHRGSWVTHASQEPQGIASAIIVTHSYMAMKKPAPTPSTNSAYRVSGIITPVA
jgi:hypothetical protein